MTLTRNIETPKLKEYWDKAEATLRMVEQWPQWKRDVQIGSKPVDREGVKK